MSRKVYDVRTGVTQVGVSLKKKLAALGVGSAVIATGVVVPMMAHAAPTQVVVTPTNTQGWSTADTRPGGAVSFVADVTAPGTPNTGALQLTTDATTAAKAQYLHGANTALTGVTELSYQTKQNTVSFPQAAPSYQVTACLTGVTGVACTPGLTGTPNPTSFDTLVFEPYQNTSQGPVLPSVWQEWDVDNGLFWSSRTVVCENGTINGTAGGPATYTLAQIEAICPNAVVNGFGVNIGTFNPGYDVETDLVKFNDTTYNFELVAPTVSKPVITLPANNSTLTTAQAVKIDWTDSVASIGGAVTYNYRAYSDAAYTNLVYGTTGLSASEIPTPNTPEGVYYVQVQAVDSGNNLSAWSNDASNPYKITIHNPVVLGSKDACKNDGWKTSEMPVFKNQGDCVSYFASNKSKN